MFSKSEILLKKHNELHDDSEIAFKVSKLLPDRCYFDHRLSPANIRVDTLDTDTIYDAFPRLKYATARAICY